ncbi:MAG: UDP-N-acetylmuramate--L-alanine ligase [Spirochaetaceae bacterium]|nr:UDP-N-acetylmuramate--L-alanine ligase [Spirochaetaceae bacterium]
MPDHSFPASLKGIHAHFVGAKGTGMAALAEIFVSEGAILSGSDVPDHFYTDEVLRSIGLVPFESFDSAHVGDDVQLVIYSAAYDPAVNPELLEAEKRGIPLFSYPQALGQLSRRSDSSGIAGVHGKTTTTAMTGSILEALKCPATILAGSAVSSFGDRCTYIGGNRFFVAETCEYKRHFLNFAPRRILLTSVESDHQDYYPTYESIRGAFIEYVESLPEAGRLIYCADDAGATQVAMAALAKRPDIILIPYGFAASGPFRIRELRVREGRSEFSLDASLQEFSLGVPGKHLVLDAAGAISLAVTITQDSHKGQSLSQSEWATIAKALGDFRGSKRRSEIVGSAGGVLIMDDYAHHPTAIRDTIEGLKSFWPSRRLIVDFMSHTYSRTKALLDEFSESFSQADCVILHGIYPSAREKPIEGVNGRSLFEKTKALNPAMTDLTHSADEGVPGQLPARYPDRFLIYTESIDEAPELIFPQLREGDLFITMGAGDNWKIGKSLLAMLEKEKMKG